MCVFSDLIIYFENAETIGGGGRYVFFGVGNTKVKKNWKAIVERKSIAKNYFQETIFKQ